MNTQQNGAAKKPGANNQRGNQSNPQQPPKPEDKDSPEYKKKQAIDKGPLLNMGFSNAPAYDMPTSLYTTLKDIFEAIVSDHRRSGIISPFELLEVLKNENEMFRSAMHQDAHEFLNLLLNSVMENIEAHDRVLKEKQKALEKENPQQPATEEEKADGTVSFPSILPTPSAGSAAQWLHELFEGTLTSETRCLTCENTSQRDEPFLDLSVDLEQHSSVTACLRRFSEEEMLCERNKFHCDNCGGLQEAEKRMKIKRLPKVLALHLKRFKYTEDLQRLQKLFHKVVYPYHLRLFNTTDDAEDPDRLYELYAVVIHIGGGPYHGHYVSIIKTHDRGWLLFDDEMVEPVDRTYVKNFFGDKPGLACAYVLFYQETTLEAVQREQRMEGKRRASQDAGVGLGVHSEDAAELHRVVSDPTVSVTENFANLAHAATAPPKAGPNGHVEPPLPKTPVLPVPATTTPTPAPASTTDPAPAPAAPPTVTAPRPVSPVVQSKKEKQKEEKAAEKARKAAEKQAEKDRVEAEKERRKQLAGKLADAQKRQEAELKMAMEASRQSKLEEDSRRGIETKENDAPSSTAAATVGATSGNGANGNGSGVASGLDRFRRSKSLRFGSLGSKKEKVQIQPTVPEKGGLTRSVTENLGRMEGEGNVDSTTALIDEKKNGEGAAAASVRGSEGKREASPAPPSQPVFRDTSVVKEGKEQDVGKEGKEKEKKNRFSIRKKSFGMLS
jgi:ubiquitin carboxyl-terminal hydrolase 9/13